MVVSTAPFDNARVVQEAARRRTFAIISHPDAGKTTLTEKTLLYAGGIGVAGAVRGRKAQPAGVCACVGAEDLVDRPHRDARHVVAVKLGDAGDEVAGALVAGLENGRDLVGRLDG